MKRGKASSDTYNYDCRADCSKREFASKAYAIVASMSANLLWKVEAFRPMQPVVEEMSGYIIMLTVLAKNRTELTCSPAFLEQCAVR